MNNLNEYERKQLSLMKCWVKISMATGRNGGTHNAFVEDWKKLQNSIVERMSVKGSKKLINLIEKDMEKYIENLDKN